MGIAEGRRAITGCQLARDDEMRCDTHGDVLVLDGLGGPKRRSLLLAPELLFERLAAEYVYAQVCKAALLEFVAAIELSMR